MFDFSAGMNILLYKIKTIPINFGIFIVVAVEQMRVYQYACARGLHFCCCYCFGFCFYCSRCYCMVCLMMVYYCHYADNNGNQFVKCHFRSYVHLAIKANRIDIKPPYLLLSSGYMQIKRREAFLWYGIRSTLYVYFVYMLFMHSSLYLRFINKLW